MSTDLFHFNYPGITYAIMRELFRDITNSIVNNISAQANTSVLHMLSTQVLFIPLYHAVSNKKIPHTSGLYHVPNKKMFRNDLDFLLKHFTPVTIKEIEDHVLLIKILSKPSFHLTIDDGLKECREIIAPILLEKGIPASFFINTAFIDNNAMCYLNRASLIINKFNHNSVTKKAEIEINEMLTREGLTGGNIASRLLSVDYKSAGIIDQIVEILDIDIKDYLKKEKPYLTKYDIVSLQKDGFEIGSHSIDHPRYNSLSYKEQLFQTTESIRYLKENFKPRFSLFAFPFSDDGVSAKFFKRIFNPVAPLVNLSFGTSGIRLDIHPAHLHRAAMDESPSPAKHLINAEYIKYLLRKSIGRVRIRRK